MVAYNGEAIIDKDIRFYTVEFCNGDETEVDFDFPDYAGSYFRVYNERSGRLLTEVALTRNGANLIINSSEVDMTLEDLGNYYYEIGYIRSVYEQVLRFGILTVL